MSAPTTGTAPPRRGIPEPPGPKQRFPFAFARPLARDPLGFLGRLARDYGDVARVAMGTQPIVLLSHPDLVRDVLVTHGRNFTKGRGLERAQRLLGKGLLTSEGAFHLRQRRLAQPAFHRQRIAAYGDTMASFAARTGAGWRDGARIDIHEQMMRLTLAIVGQTLFDADVEGEAAEIGEALTIAFESFVIAIMPFSEILEKLPLPMTRRFERARDRLDRTIYRIIAERRASGEDRGDLLSMLLLAQDVEGDGGGMSDEQLRDEAMTIFLAGHETTANALTWSWYLLSEHPEVERRMHEEVDALLGGPGPTARVPTTDDVARLPYVRRVLAESMRLYPPAWIIGRRAIDAYDVGQWQLRPRTIVLLSPWLMHRDPRFWPEPERFDPERWTDDAQAARPKFAYFPFGAGTRVCIGEQFAWMEGVLVLATLASRWRMRLAPDARVDLLPLITLRPKYGMPMTVETRHARTP